MIEEQVKAKNLLDIFKKSDEDLSTFLEDDNIKNILLSGRFGIGKTTFIDEYFDQNKTTYELIKISPVNYSILSNQDIFRYIKYDILYILLEKVDFNLKSEDIDLISWIQGLPIYLRANIITLLGSLIFLLPKIGKPAEKIFNLAINHKNEFEKILDLANQDPDTQYIRKFNSQIEQEEGGLYENNEITKIINEILDLHNSKKRVLVIDDLDRVDPKHIFRILNVLSAQSSYNKFNFDKIILICDIENIRNIFSAKYGQRTDFSGYIDKFYDKEIFYFDNRESISININDILTSIQLESKNSQFNKFLDENKKSFIDTLTIILTDLVMLNKINLRTLLKYKNKELVLKQNKISYKKGKMNSPYSVYNYQFQTVLVFDILYKLLDNDIERLLKFLSTKKSTFNYINEQIGNSLLIIEMEKFDSNGKRFIYKDESSKTLINYSPNEERITNVRYSLDVKFISTTIKGSEKETNLPLVYNLLHEAYLKLKELNYF